MLTLVPGKLRLQPEGYDSFKVSPTIRDRSEGRVKVTVVVTPVSRATRLDVVITAEVIGELVAAQVKKVSAVVLRALVTS